MIYPKTWILRLEKLFTTRSFLFSSQEKGSFILRLSLQHGQSSAISYTSIDMQADENVENISRSYFAIFSSQRALRPGLVLYRTIRYAKILNHCSDLTIGKISHEVNYSQRSESQCTTTVLYLTRRHTI